MAREVIFDSPFLLGFDETRVLIERISRSSEGYPPYNVEVLSEDRLRISIAVAGFARDQLRIELRGAQLTVIAARDRGGDGPERDFVHRGIGLRAFARSFVLGDGWQVEGAALAHGLLHIELKRPEPNDDVRIVPIEVRE